jgi:hypothetical protein
MNLKRKDISVNKHSEAFLNMNKGTVVNFFSGAPI